VEKATVDPVRLVLLYQGCITLRRQVSALCSAQHKQGSVAGGESYL
jgi:hypothetical protein